VPRCGCSSQFGNERLRGSLTAPIWRRRAGGECELGHAGGSATGMSLTMPQCSSSRGIELPRMSQRSLATFPGRTKERRFVLSVLMALSGAIPQLPQPLGIVFLRTPMCIILCSSREPKQWLLHLTKGSHSCQRVHIIPPLLR
jgi:hypothetical protein